MMRRLTVSLDQTLETALREASERREVAGVRSHRLRAHARPRLPRGLEGAALRQPPPRRTPPPAKSCGPLALTAGAARAAARLAAAMASSFFMQIPPLSRTRSR